MKYCTKCGAELQAQTKFCTKCGAATSTTASSASGVRSSTQPVTAAAAHEAARQTGAPVAKSFAASPKIAVAAIGVVVLLAVIVVASLGYAIHRARARAQERQAAETFERKLAKLAPQDPAAIPKGATSPADMNKSISALAAAANAMTQTAQKQGGTDPLKAIQGVVGASSGSASAPKAAADRTAQIAAASTAADAALNPPSPPAVAPVEPEAATGNQAHDWALEYERTVGGPEADMVVRTGDINNLGFGWPPGFDPFSGQSTPSHQWPDNNHIPPKAPAGTDRILVGTSVMPVHMSLRHETGQADQIVIDSLTRTISGDGYSGTIGDCYFLRDNLLQRIPGAFRDQLNHDLDKKLVLTDLPESLRDDVPSALESQLSGFFTVNSQFAANCTRERAISAPTPIVLPVGTFRFEIHDVVFQMFVDDFQPRPMHSHFQVSLNGTRIPSFEYAINSLDQSGPIGKLLTLRLLPEYWPLVESGTVKLLIDDPTTRVQDGYAVDFVRILLNPYKFKYQVSLAARVIDADKHTPIAGATVNAALETSSTDKEGRCELKGIPAGLVIATASAQGYDADSTPVDLVAGQAGSAEIQLHRHQETTAALEQAIEQTGTATIYGIHFDTDSSKIRGDSIPALNAVLGLIHNHPGARWVIAGHTDNQGDAAHNQTLSESRSKSVIAWLKQHRGDVSNLVPQGFGATRPVADNATANGRALNRRVEVALEKQ